jgi:hypothetical protein
MLITILKVCSKCKKDKSFSEFHKDKNRKDGHYCICKQCILDYKKKYPWKTVFRSIKTRCNSPKYINYKDYGGRGIECRITENELKELWFRDKAWLLNRPSIDRKNDDGDYEFSNCQFIELKDNVSKRNTKFLSLQILQYSKTKELIKKWNSIREASRTLNVDNADITKCAKGRVKSAGGYIWRYFK